MYVLPLSLSQTTTKDIFIRENISSLLSIYNTPTLQLYRRSQKSVFWKVENIFVPHCLHRCCFDTQIEQKINRTHRKAGDTGTVFDSVKDKAKTKTKTKTKIG